MSFAALFCVVAQRFPRLQLCFPKKRYVTVQRMAVKETRQLQRPEESVKPGSHSDMSTSISIPVVRTPTAQTHASEDEHNTS